MAEVMDGAIMADAAIITGGVEVVATTMVGGIITTGDLTSASLAQAGTAKACSSRQINVRQPCVPAIPCSNDVSQLAMHRSRKAGSPSRNP